MAGMQVFTSKKALTEFLAPQRGNTRLGMVPTMGALHSGHLSLVEKAIDENDLTIVSIFVNPTQFNNAEDLEKYPRTLERDLELLSQFESHLAVFAPDIEEMYSEDVVSVNYHFGALERVMEGAFRPGHFDGVGTIVEALLRAVYPNRAYFGEKDFQQLQIIRKLVRMRKIPVQIVGCPILREDHGLAMSSRNERLSSALREEAGLIYKLLRQAKQEFGTKSVHSLKREIEATFDQHPNFTLEYFEIAHAEDLKPVIRKHKGKKYRAFIAAYLGGVRLIDNIALN